MACRLSLKAAKGALEVGDEVPVRINCNVGANNLSQLQYELERVAAIKNSEVWPDCFMDLSIGQYERPLYQLLQSEFGCPVGIVPAYLFKKGERVTDDKVIDLLKRLADEGLSFFTLHLTASRELFQLAKETRRIPVTSRGGAIVLQQMLAGVQDDNIWQRNLEQIINIAKMYGIAISLGTTFRPAGICDACDEVHVKETQEQLKLCKLLQAEGVQVMLENVGHISMDKLEQHSQTLRAFNAPIMPLGPILTDSAVGKDHIAAAIGAAFMGYKGCAHIINCITSSEHTRSFFTIEETLEAIKTAQLAAHIIDVSKGIGVEKDTVIYNERAKKKSCVVAEKDCDRCSKYCPMKMEMNNG